jgi:hypothetical protein
MESKKFKATPIHLDTSRVDLNKLRQTLISKYTEGNFYFHVRRIKYKQNLQITINRYD